MTRLIAEDLLLLCWDDDRGRVHSACSDALAAGVGGALVLDALRADALVLRDQRVQVSHIDPQDGLLAEVVAEATRSRRAPTLRTLVPRVGTKARLHAVLDRLVDAGVMYRDDRRVLGLVPIKRFGVTDRAASAALREIVRDLLTGRRGPEQTDIRYVLLASLAGPTQALGVLVDRSDRRGARKRAEAFSKGQGVPEAVGRTVQEANAAIYAAVTAAVVASSSDDGSAGS